MKPYNFNDILVRRAKTDERLKENIDLMQKLIIEYSNADVREKSAYAGKLAFLCQDSQRLSEGLEVLNKQVETMMHR